MILITSLKKQRWVGGKPTEELYDISSYVNPDHIKSLAPTKTSIIDERFNLNYHAVGSRINMMDGSTLTANISPKEIVKLIDKCYE